MGLYYSEIYSIVGKLKLVANEHALVAILWEHEKPNRVKLDSMVKNENHEIIQATKENLIKYFEGQRIFFNVPLELNGSNFQKEVWDVLKEIPYGTTMSYAEVAKKINNPQAVRAVGTAIGKNPISIIIPCHRVIGTNGKLTGFAGGLEGKRILLELESKNS